MPVEDFNIKHDTLHFCYWIWTCVCAHFGPKHIPINVSVVGDELGPMYLRTCQTGTIRMSTSTAAVSSGCMLDLSA